VDIKQIETVMNERLPPIEDGDHWSCCSDAIIEDGCYLTFHAGWFGDPWTITVDRSSGIVVGFVPGDIDPESYCMQDDRLIDQPS